MERPLNIATLPAGTWGAAFSKIAAEAGHNVRMLLRDTVDYQTFLDSRQYLRRLPGIEFPENVTATNSAQATLEGADVVVLAPPSKFLRSSYREIREENPQGVPIILLTKGLERDTNKTGSQVLEDEEPGISQRLAVLSGPNFAEEAAAGLPMATTLASSNFPLAERLQHDFSSPTFRIYAQNDVLGVELGGAIKNVVAFAAGIGDGLKRGESARAALIDRGLIEVIKFVTSVGGKPETLMGLSGVGDLILTCTSDLSRNHQAGKELAEGKITPQDLFTDKERTVEALYTVRAVVELARAHDIEVPIAKAVYMVLYEKLSIEKAYISLMGRPLVHENGQR